MPRKPQKLKPKVDDRDLRVRMNQINWEDVNDLIAHKYAETASQVVRRALGQVAKDEREKRRRGW